MIRFPIIRFGFFVSIYLCGLVGCCRPDRQIVQLRGDDRWYTLCGNDSGQDISLLVTKLGVDVDDYSRHRSQRELTRTELRIAEVNGFFGRGATTQSAEDASRNTVSVSLPVDLTLSGSQRLFTLPSGRELQARTQELDAAVELRPDYLRARH